MVVIVYRGADCCIVLVPLILGDLPISVPVIKAAEELREGLVLRHLSALHLRMEPAVVDSPQIRSIDVAVAVSVEFQKGLVDQCLSPGVGLAPNPQQELVEAHCAVLVLVKVVKQYPVFLRTQIYAVLAKAHGELLAIHLLVPVKGV